MILRRYIHREIAEKLGWIIGLLALIIMSNRFVRYLADAAAGVFPADLVFRSLLMKMLATLPKLMPIAIFLAVLLGLSRLARDRELTVVSASGSGYRVQLVSILQLSVLFSLIVFATSFYVAPWAAQNTATLRAQAEVEAETAAVAAGKFNEMSRGEQVIYIERASSDRTRMENIFLQARRDQQTSVINSRSASYRTIDDLGGKFLLFEHGRRYTSSRDALDYRITRYRTYAVLVEQSDAQRDYIKLEAVPTATLLGSDNPQHQAELQWRLSFVIASLLLPVLALALSRYSFSEQKYFAAFVAVLIYIIYSNLLSIAKTMLKRDEIPAFIGLWWVHLALLALIVCAFVLPRLRLRMKQGTPQPQAAGHSATA
ncbi:MAG: LPS export ABC transporter permease LptF [Gammaproteobacteria bacterium]|nr:LPS export ABC transporter permease LptF [Gammaproteobacteria bacterium]MCY4337636.1 LPS export ABC transporter permease LptF [Gammaproteobacteria bacterium]